MGPWHPSSNRRQHKQDPKLVGVVHAPLVFGDDDGTTLHRPRIATATQLTEVVPDPGANAPLPRVPRATAVASTMEMNSGEFVDKFAAGFAHQCVNKVPPPRRAQVCSHSELCR